MPVLIGESNVAIVPAIGGYGVQVEDIYHLGEFSPHFLVLESGRYLRYISRVGRTRVALSLNSPSEHSDKKWAGRGRLG